MNNKACNETHLYNMEPRNTSRYVVPLALLTRITQTLIQNPCSTGNLDSIGTGHTGRRYTIYYTDFAHNLSLSFQVSSLKPEQLGR